MNYFHDSGNDNGNYGDNDKCNYKCNCDYEASPITGIVIVMEANKDGKNFFLILLVMMLTIVVI